MKYNNTYEEYFISLVGSVINKKAVPSIPNNVAVEELYSLAKKHSLTGILYFGLNSLENVPQSSIMQTLRSLSNQERVKEATQQVELSLFTQRLNKLNIPFIKLKGSVIKNLYPRPDFRTMSDLDILIHKKDLEKVTCELLNNKYSYLNEIYDVYSFVKPPYVNIEVHTVLIWNKEKSKELLGDIWEKAVKKNSSEYSLTNEDFYIFMILHLKKHFCYGGIGIRFIADIWLFLKEYQDKLNYDYLEKVLNNLNCLEFSKRIEQLANSWFGGEIEKTDLNLVSTFIINSGTYGNLTNRLINESNITKASSIKIKYITSVLFPTYKGMTMLYPKLEKAPVLLPFFWIYRLFDRFLLNTNKVKKQKKIVSSVNNSKTKQAMQVRKQAGILDIE